MYKKIITLGKTVIDALYPPACAICGKPLSKKADACNPPGAHAECASYVHPISGVSCSKCGKPIDEDNYLCKDCSDTKHTFTQAVAAYEISPDLKDSLYRFKYKNKREYALFFANSIFKAHKNLLHFWQPELIIPIPMHHKKERIRGYNQAALIAKELGRFMEIPVDTDILKRIKKTVPLKDCTSDARRVILKGAFELSSVLNVKRVLLVDDIYTTGATLDECASVLRSGGAQEIYCANVCTGAGI